VSWPAKDDFASGNILTASQMNSIGDNLNDYGDPSVKTWSNPIAGGITVGNGTLEANYWQMGKMVFAQCLFDLGSTSAVTTLITINMPVEAIAREQILGDAVCVQGSTRYLAQVRGSTEILAVLAVPRYNGSASGYQYLDMVNISSTVPFTWATGDYFSFQIIYQAAS
jgi:hypothetical protein